MTKYKQVIIVRKDLKLSIGKTASQVAHAALGSVKLVDKQIIERWEAAGSKKVVLKVNDLKELLAIYKSLKDKKIPCALIKDAGLTQLKPGTVTVLGIGPYDEKKIDKVTGKLKLL